MLVQAMNPTLHNFRIELSTPKATCQFESDLINHELLHMAHLIGLEEIIPYEEDGDVTRMCTKAKQGKMKIYFHPQHIDGILTEELIQKAENVVKTYVEKYDDDVLVRFKKMHVYPIQDYQLEELS